MSPTQIKRTSLSKSGVSLFWRENGPKHPSRTIVLLHGFPSSSHQYRHLIPLLAARYRVIAPDLPGFGFTGTPDNFTYTFDSLADVVEEFLATLSIDKYSVYIFDYGAPVGLRLALRRPDAIDAIITQNGNAYIEGFGDVWAPIQEFWASNNKADDRAKIADSMLNFDITKFQYVNGTPDVDTIAPESYTLDYALLQRSGRREAQVDLFRDYQTNIFLYEKFQAYFRSSQIPLLAVWGKNDVFFIPPGAEAFKKDLPNAVIKFLDAGHFAVESHTSLIRAEIFQFLDGEPDTKISYM
ncbi:Epoxide hydrolase-like protein [Beauveria brongniartii RCEF 3172]|uniref:Epoxide hydrolase-like protein n=1 Tax=Beauveria brongniartii RCEF 3172 TaxID=1081107 RepID=A0A168CDV4_9HYPO|nr:Epoxide hydrolase-like protein [Beauveria brongniartii RCEF 3172]